MTHDIASLQLAEQLRALTDGEVLALAIPHQRQDDRAAALDHFQRVFAALRDAGWHIRAGVRRMPDGEVLYIEPLAAPPPPAERGPNQEEM
jgi:hypothetical protein